MDNQCYFNGDFWQCLTDTTAGDSPTSAAAKWRRVQIPAQFRRVLAQLTYAGLLELDGQNDKATRERSRGESWLDDLVREAANRESNRTLGTSRQLTGGTVRASVILDDAERLMRWDTTQLETSEEQDARMSLSLALQQVWEAWWWSTLMICTQEQLRDAYDSATTYVAGDEVFYPADGKYYLCLQTCLGIAPATLSGGDYAVNSKFWILAPTTLTGEDYVADTAYDWGTTVRNPDDGLYYARSGSVYITDSFSDLFTGLYHIVGIHDGKVAWCQGDATLTANVFDGADSKLLLWENVYLAVETEWFLSLWAAGFKTGRIRSDGSTVMSPELVESWQIYTNAAPVTETFTAGTPPAPPDTGSWGLLNTFDPLLAIAGTVRTVSQADPRVNDNPSNYSFDPTPDGVRVPAWTAGSAWIWRRRVTPVLTGDAFDEETTYEATPTNELVYDS